MDIIIHKLTELWIYDVSIFSQGWIYYCFFIPFIFYFAFFTMKWAILSLPIWLPFTIICNNFLNIKEEIVEDKVIEILKAIEKEKIKNEEKEEDG